MHKSVLDYCAKWKRVIFLAPGNTQFVLSLFFLEGGFSLVTQGRLEDPPSPSVSECWNYSCVPHTWLGMIHFCLTRPPPLPLLHARILDECSAMKFLD